VIKGVKRGFAEDSWKTIEFVNKARIVKSGEADKNSVRMNVVKPCSRCKMPSVDVNTGVMDPENRVTKVLKTFRTGEICGFEHKEENWAKQVGFLNSNFAVNSLLLPRFLLVKTWITRRRPAESSALEMY